MVETARCGGAEARVTHQAGREGHVVGCHGFAVVPVRAAVEIERPRAGIQGAGPAGGQVGSRGARRVDAHQGIEDAGRRIGAGGGTGQQRVKRVRGARLQHGERRAAGQRLAR